MITKLEEFMFNELKIILGPNSKQLKKYMADLK